MNLRYKTPDHRQADALLYEIASARMDLDSMMDDLARELDVVKARYSEGVGILERALSEKELELHALQKMRSDVLFDGADRVNLSHGSLLHRVEMRVIHARGVLEKIEEMGRNEAIKVAKSVDWDKLKKWSDEELEAAGTRRERRDTYEYELAKA